MSLKNDAKLIMDSALASALPDNAVRAALLKAQFGTGKLILIAAGKAAWQMAKAAYDQMGNRIDSGVVVTKVRSQHGSDRQSRYL